MSDLKLEMDYRAQIANGLGKIKGLFTGKKKPAAIGGAVLTVVLVVGLAFGLSKGKKHDEKHAAAETKEGAHSADSEKKEDGKPGEAASAGLTSQNHSEGGTFSSLVSTYAKAWRDTQDKVEVIHQAIDENEKLKLENANLRLRAESLQFDCTLKAANARTRNMELKLSSETGARVGRTLASIEYRPPTHLLPPQLYTLAISYFKAREDEKATVILTHLTGMEENDSYKTARNFLLTGIGWYRLDNYDLAEQYFQRSLEGKEAQTVETAQYHAQARLWRGLVAERIGKHAKAQQWLRELLDFHPHSVEASWINTGGQRRAPSSSEEEEE